ncbi:hypothetical protein V8E36_002847 [Tilletia maclaganii]
MASSSSNRSKSGGDGDGDGSSKSVALAQSASLLITLQVGTRLLTFALNQLLVRLTDPSVFGTANVQLDLLLSTILFLARDGVRGAMIRSTQAAAAVADGAPISNGAQRKSKRALLPAGLHNIALLPVPAGLAIASIATFVYTTKLAPKELVDSHRTEFSTSVALYVLGAVLELLSEPFYNRASVSLNIQLRVKAEGAAVIAKGVATLAFMAASTSRFSSSDKVGKGLIAFGLGQAAYGAATLLVFLNTSIRAQGMCGTVDALLPAKPLPNQPRLDASTLSLTWVLFKQSLLKHLLTESDKLAVARIGTLSDQGGYALASNYGSLVARMLFQPLEESSRIIFSTQLGAVRQKQPKTVKVQEAPAVSATNGLGPALNSSTGLLSSLLHFYALLAALLFAFAPPLATPGLFLLAGSRWARSTSASSILGSYAGIYLGVMGFNGILEGFLQATASEAELGTYSAVMIASSGAFVASLAAFSRLPSSASSKLGSSSSSESALVYANSLALTLRAVWSWAYVLRFVRDTAKTRTATRDTLTSDGKQSAAAPAAANSVERPLHPRAILPAVPTLLTFAATGLYLRYDSFDAWRASQSVPPPASLRTVLPFLAKGVACAFACLSSIAMFERRRIANTLSTLRSGRR